MAPSITRREALGGAAAALVLASCGGDDDPAPAVVRRLRSGAALLGSPLALEHAVVAAYAASEEVLRGDALRTAREIGEQERAHATRLQGLIARPRRRPALRPQRRGVRPHVPAPARRTGRAPLRRATWSSGTVRAYLEALAELADLELRTAAGRIGADEGAHLGAVRVLQGLPAAQGPFVTGRSMADRADVERLEDLLGARAPARVRLRGGAAPRGDRTDAAEPCATRSASTSRPWRRRSPACGHRNPLASVPAPELGAVLRDRDAFARFALDLEDEAVAAYAETAAAIRDPRLRQPLGSIMASEAAHAVALRDAPAHPRSSIRRCRRVDYSGRRWALSRHPGPLELMLDPRDRPARARAAEAAGGRALGRQGNA